MRRGTTPTHIFTSDIDLTDAEEIYITYKQGCKKIEKTKDDIIELTPDTVKVELTQEETLMFSSCKDDVEIQFRVKFPGGKAPASNIVTAPVERILKEGVI